MMMWDHYVHNTLSPLRNVLSQVLQLTMYWEIFPCPFFFNFFFTAFSKRRLPISSFWSNVLCRVPFQMLALGAFWIDDQQVHFEHFCEVTNNGIWRTGTGFPRACSLRTPVVWDAPWGQRRFCGRIHLDPAVSCAFSKTVPRHLEN